MNRQALFVAIVPPLAIPYFLWRFAYLLPWTPLRIAALAATLIGLALVTLARFQLGNSFSLTPQARKLVTHGLYSRIRNPIYVFGTIVLAGMAIYTGYPWFLLLVLILVPMQMWRARAEARVLEERFGEEYLAYRARTWF
jgi:protein-S-isoprenylcysteine O-methyltransferase Ste14